ncbi:MAG TPA: IclR family transcriptional regulator [Chloroflexota bacterium]|jgi:DNA-binding IclR family transcriptional regulator|nr:IclR family transcriptional regulator [Chloroflexota bacterium]
MTAGRESEPGAPDAIRVVERAFAVLEAIGAEPEGVPVAQVRARTGLPLVTVYRLLRTLQALGYAATDPDTGRFRVGLRVLELRGRVSDADRLAGLARPLLKDLMLASGGLAHLGLYRQGEVIYVDTVRDLRSLDQYVPPGHRMPAHSVALGKVLLAELGDEQLRRLAEEKGLPVLASRTIASADELLAEAARVRAAGYAVEADEAAEGSRSVAAPVRDYTERAVAALAVSGFVDRPLSRFGDQRRGELIALVTDAARRLSARLGFVPSPGSEPVGAWQPAGLYPATS